jgi:NAD(P)H-nitrite reductase large subunit
MRGIIDSILAYYRLHGKDKERLGDTLDRTGWDQFIETVIPQEYRLIGSANDAYPYRPLRRSCRRPSYIASKSASPPPSARRTSSRTSGPGPS